MKDNLMDILMNDKPITREQVLTYWNIEVVDRTEDLKNARKQTKEAMDWENRCELKLQEVKAKRDLIKEKYDL